MSNFTYFCLNQVGVKLRKIKEILISKIKYLQNFCLTYLNYKQTFSKMSNRGLLPAYPQQDNANLLTDGKHCQEEVNSPLRRRANANNSQHSRIIC